MPHSRCPVTVGRDAELAALRVRVTDAVAGHGGTTALVAEAGAGKSRLTREAAALAGERGGRVLVGRAVAGRTAVPFRPLVEALGAALRTGWSVPDLGGWATALAPLLPASGGEHAPVGLTAVAEALLRCLRDLAGDRSLLLVLEDLQWADSETLTVLEYLADNLADTRVAALLTCRDDAGEATSLLEALARRGALDVLRLGRLDRSAVAGMAEACTGRPPEPAALAALVARSEGLPLFVEELVGGERTGVPPTFRDSVQRRLAELPPTSAGWWRRLRCSTVTSTGSWSRRPAAARRRSCWARCAPAARCRCRRRPRDGAAVPARAHPGRRDRGDLPARPRAHRGPRPDRGALPAPEPPRHHLPAGRGAR